MLCLQRRRFGFQRIKRGPWENGEGGNISAEWSSRKNQTQKEGCPLVPLRTPTRTATLRAPFVVCSWQYHCPFYRGRLRLREKGLSKVTQQ